MHYAVLNTHDYDVARNLEPRSADFGKYQIIYYDSDTPIERIRKSAYLKSNQSKLFSIICRITEFGKITVIGRVVPSINTWISKGPMEQLYITDKKKYKLNSDGTLKGVSPEKLRLF